MKIRIDRNNNLPLYLQIKNQIEEGIIAGKYPYGFILPSERKLAQALEVNRNTTIKAYEKLKDEDLIDSKVGKGTFVIYNQNIKNNQNPFHEMYWDRVVGNFSFENSIDIMAKIMSDVKEKNLISLSGGFPSKKNFPYETFKNLTNDILMSNQDVFFQTPVRGDKNFRKILQNYLYEEKSIRLLNNELMVTSGAQQGLNLVISTFIKPGDLILVENPTFFGAIQLFKKAGAKLINSNLKSNGLDLNHVEYNLKKNDIKFIYLLPNYQNPTGNLMDLQSRKDILYLAKKYRTPIIEEDPYGELYYEKYMPTIKSLDQDNFVIYIGTFSKTISPGFRIGYVAADEDVIKKLVLLKQFVDIHANTLSQHIIGEFINQGYYDDHLEKMRSLYLEKRDVMGMYLEYAKDSINYMKPMGGYYYWCEVLGNVSLKEMLSESMKKGVDFIPGEFFFSEAAEGENHFRLNFTHSSKEEIQKGMEILIDILKK